ncbi:retinol dehydrogenase 7-like [Biomphalaria glabrata]|uniref:Retinol dehydrogenase 7-like n=2 Tax=Biomphalaria glabrata TaxID=6526 RepID=A0A9W3BK65_BIOGL|nr:retinol dehydrogenase 7-like [Biomphalaria glabrata]KAI8729518.1 retinol dehydrogenase 7 [Biomphalaria glabrata]
MEIDIQDEINKDDIVFYSVLYSTVTLAFAIAVVSKFFTNEFRFGFRSFLTLIILFLGEPLCQFLVKGPQGLLLFSVGCLIIYSILPANNLPADKKSVLITGCDSGFGNALALKLDSLGMQVFAGCLDEQGAGAKDLKSKCSDRLKLLRLDVTKPKDIEAAASLIKSTVGDEGLWGLVNNAGVWYFADLEITSDQILQKVMDVNLFGAIRLTKAVLPLIKQAHGRIINVSSLLGRISLEGNGAYSMSKHALVAFSNTLRLEMKKWEVDVSIVEPIAYYTGNMQGAALMERKEELWDSLNEETKKIYNKAYLDDAYSHLDSSFQKYSKDLTPVIRCMRSALLSKRPKERYPCDTGAEILFFLCPLLPVWLADCLSNSICVLPRRLRLNAYCEGK